MTISTLKNQELVLLVFHAYILPMGEPKSIVTQRPENRVRGEISRLGGSVESEAESGTEIVSFRNLNLVHELRSVSYLQSESEPETYDGEIKKSEN